MFYSPLFYNNVVKIIALLDVVEVRHHNDDTSKSIKKTSRSRD
jgi:hypothetical protein